MASSQKLRRTRAPSLLILPPSTYNSLSAMLLFILFSAAVRLWCLFYLMLQSDYAVYFIGCVVYINFRLICWCFFINVGILMVLFILFYVAFCRWCLYYIIYIFYLCLFIYIYWRGSLRVVHLQTHFSWRAWDARDYHKYWLSRSNGRNLIDSKELI